MHHRTQRFGAGRAASNYTFRADQPLEWRKTDERQFEAQVVLDELHSGELLVPSFILLSSQPYSYVASVTSGDHQWRLEEVASHAKHPLAPKETQKPQATKANRGNEISTHIDLFAIHRTQVGLTLSICLYSNTIPQDYLLVVSRRARHLDVSNSLKTFSPLRFQADVPALSQMVQPKAQRHRTCSPTSLAMVMAYHGAPYHPATINACRDSATGMYGVWPLNIVQAGQRGFTGAVELVSSWGEVAGVRHPFIASISFASGALDGAPLAETAGHLVVVCGATKDGVLCNDPAAETAATVNRRYDLEQFTNAWLGSRGAAYFIAPANTPDTLG